MVWANVSFLMSINVVFFVLCDFQVVDQGFQKVLVLEDDVRFEPWFKRRLETIMGNADKTQLDWDLM